MDIKAYMYGFINENQKRFAPATYIERILNVRIKDCDDDHGAMGEHYVVKLERRVPDFTMTKGTQYKVIKCECLVNAKQFNDFVEKHKAIIWL